jgi:hypothetical protein
MEPVADSFFQFPIGNEWKEGDAFRKVQTNHEIMELSGTHHILAAYLL